jgi:GrpB-like predicted nucleotidyltransferase (UPF0157 family)
MFGNTSHDVHLHVWQSGDAEIERHLRFRDRKRRLAKMEWATQNDYAQAKSPVIDQILARARKSSKP